MSRQRKQRKAKRVEVIVRATIPPRMSSAHFRRLVKDQLNSPIYLSIGDQLDAETNRGQIAVTVSAGRRLIRT